MKISDLIASVPSQWASLTPWDLTSNAPAMIESIIAALPVKDAASAGIAIHQSAHIEQGAILKPPIFIGPNCYVAAGAYLRGGVWLEGNVIIGPHCEVKTTFMFSGSKIAHLSFVGDSIVGHNVNVEAGAMLANYRNEKADKRIRFKWQGSLIDTGVDKFGSIVGDNTRIGANAVIAPGAALAPSSIVKRLELIDQS
jgi:UDP-N-acetylglucosamine diphosphorylase / glucose-1-phosphate thymidylyltransferase / UDP-N-acetylgalactosamine diphosphorylase / glucosamine-1-phosphate N-acetyltransferase / galactosamine-1-phosphate N-acetyltransferase